MREKRKKERSGVRGEREGGIKKGRGFFGKKIGLRLMLGRVIYIRRRASGARVFSCHVHLFTGHPPITHAFTKNIVCENGGIYPLVQIVC